MLSWEPGGEEDQQFKRETGAIIVTIILIILIVLMVWMLRGLP